MRNLSLDQLRTLIEVVALGSFTEAAKRLHLTQPAISQQIRELENRCGLQLVERIGKRAFATPAGSELIMHGGRIMAEVCAITRSAPPAACGLVPGRRHSPSCCRWCGKICATPILIYLKASRSGLAEFPGFRNHYCR